MNEVSGSILHTSVYKSCTVVHAIQLRMVENLEK